MEEKNNIITLCSFTVFRKDEKDNHIHVSYNKKKLDDKEGNKTQTTCVCTKTKRAPTMNKKE